MMSPVRYDPLIPREVAEKIRRPVIVRVNDIDEEAAGKFEEEMSWAHETGQPVIPVLIDSYGGDVYALLGMIAVIDNAKLPVVTICESKAMSAGAVLFGLGHERYIAPHATLMWHDIAGSADGDKKLNEFKADGAELERLERIMDERVAAHIGKPADFFTTMIDENKHANVYITAAQAKRWNIATHIGVPSFETTVSITHRFGIDGSAKSVVPSHQKTKTSLHTSGARRSRGAQ